MHDSSGRWPECHGRKLILNGRVAHRKSVNHSVHGQIESASDADRGGNDIFAEGRKFTLELPGGLIDRESYRPPRLGAARRTHEPCHRGERGHERTDCAVAV
jgi:hypothetical protein